MKSRSRYLTAAQVYEAYPTAAEDVGEPAGDQDPHDFLSDLAARNPVPAGLGFAAYFLPKREAVWWACATLRASGAVGPDDGPMIDAAENWVKNPDEANRRAALAVAMDADKLRPATWAAMAAGLCGGSIGSPEYQPVPPAPHLTAKSVKGAVQMAIAMAPFDQRDRFAAEALAQAAKLAAAADGRT